MLTSTRVFRPVCRSGSEAGKYGRTMLVCTSVISLLAWLTYSLLIPMWPREKKEDKKKDDDYGDFAKYEKMNDVEWMNQPMETIDKVTEKMMEAGKPPRQVKWGSFVEQRPHLTGLANRALTDFRYFQGELQTILTDRAKMAEIQKMQKTYDATTFDRDAAKNEMGSWIADYFDDAGYRDWEKCAMLYKAMIMSAFPPIDPLDDQKPDYASMPIDQFEDTLMKFLRVMDSHLTVEKTRMRAKVSSKLFTGSMLRR